MSRLAKGLMMGAAGGAAAEPVYVEDVFSTYVYIGNGKEQFIPNQINLGDTVTTYLTGKPLTNLSDVDSGYPVSALADGILEVSNAQSVFYTSGILDVYVDMGSPVVVTQYLISPQGNRDVNTYNNITGFNVKASNDASSWTTVTTFSTITTGIPAWNPGSFRPFVFSNSTAYRYWRIEATSNGASISEWALGVNTPGSGKGGLVWGKRREDLGYWNVLSDTERGVDKVLQSQALDGEVSRDDMFSSFNSDGFSLAQGNTLNATGKKNVVWTFRKAPGFFDVVTWAGNGVAGRTIAHNLGSVPGCIVVKRTDIGSTDPWAVYHRSLTYTSPTPTFYPAESCWLSLNATDSVTNSSMWGNTSPTSSVFSVGGGNYTNTNGATYVAYLFAHDEQIFGEGGDQSVIKCGSFTTDGSYNSSTTLGWEPQWVLVKSSSATGGWFLFDNMRGMPVSGNDNWLYANASDAESNSSVACRPNATGFTTFNLSANTTHIYIAIRRGPMKTPTDATEVFQTLLYTGTSGVIRRSTDILVDALFTQRRTGGVPYALDRLRGGVQYIATNSASTEGTQSDAITEMGNNYLNMGAGVIVNSSSSNYCLSLFRRAPGFFDVVAYTGTGANQQIPHNLGVTPEFVIFRNRLNAGTNGWRSSILSYKEIFLNESYPGYTSSVYMGNHTSTHLVTGANTADLNASGESFIAYLFATLPGISKVGSYTGTASTLNVDCGFSAGARFVMIKRTDTQITGSTPPTDYDTDWYIWDTARGIVAGNDPYLVLNENQVEDLGGSTDFIDPYSAGFTVTSSAPAALNASGGNYIFLAIA